MGTLHIAGSSGGGNGGTSNIQLITSNDTVLGFEYWVQVDASAGNVKVTLPSSNVSTTKCKNIIIERIDNTTNTVYIVPSVATESLDGTVNGIIYLYNKGDVITLTSQANGDCKITSDKRGGFGSTKSYLKATRGTSVTATNNTNIVFPTIEDYQGSNITYDSSTGIVTLKPNIKYRLRTAINHMTFASDTGYTELKFFNITSGQFVGISGAANPITRTVNEAKNLETEYTFTPTVETQISPRLTLNANLSSFASSWLEVEEISNSSSVMNTVDYIYATLNSDSTVSAGGAIPFVTKTGNILNSNGIFSLLAGKTYKLTAGLAYTGAQGGSALAQWRDITNNIVIGNTIQIFPPSNSATSTGLSTAECIITPSSNITVKVENSYVENRTFGAGANGQSYVSIIQIGSLGTTKIPTSLLPIAKSKTNIIPFGWTSATYQGFALTSSGQYSTFNIWDAFKSTPSETVFTPSGNCWFQVNLPQPTAIWCVGYQVRSNTTDRVDKVQILGSNDGVNFDELTIVVPETLTGGAYRKYPVDYMTPYQYFRIVLIGYGNIGLNKFELYPVV